MGCTLETMWILLYVSIKDPGGPDALAMISNILKRTFSHPLSSRGLKYQVTHVVGRCAAATQALLFHSQSTINVFLKGCRISGMEISIGFSLLGSSNRNFEALSLGIGFSSLSVLVLEGIIFRYKTEWKISLLIENCSSWYSYLHQFSCLDLESFLQCLYHSTFHSLAFSFMETASFFKPSDSTLLGLKFLTSLSLHRLEKSQSSAL